MWILNSIATNIADMVFAALNPLPAWMVLTLLSIVTGILALVAFKYTSNQAAIGRVRDAISANLLAIKLYKDDVGVTLRSQGRLLIAAGRLMLLSLVPLAVMLVPMVLLIAQMAMYFEFRPLKPGETSEIIAELRPPDAGDEFRASLDAPAGVIVEAGPTRMRRPATPTETARSSVAWRVRAADVGRHLLTLTLDDESVTKELVVSDSSHLRVSPVRPGATWWDQLLYPVEQPAARGALIQRVMIDDQPRGSTPVFGWNIHWLVSYFVLSMLAALVFKPILKVRL